MAGLVVYGQYHQQIVEYNAATIAEGLGSVFNGGAASIFCSFPGATQSLGYLFFIEFFVDSYIVSRAQPLIARPFLTLPLGHCHLGLPRPGQPLRGPLLRPLGNRPRLCRHGLGFRRRDNQYKPCP